MTANPADLNEYYDEIAHCNKCGFCQVDCPIFRSTGHEAGVARGRLAMLRAIIEGRLDWSDQIETPLFTCLLCGACTATCFPSIPTAELVVKARTVYLNRVGRKPVHRLLFDHLLPHPQRLRWAARALALGKKTGMSDLAQALGLLRIFGRNIFQAHGMLDNIPLKPFRERYKPGVYAGQGVSLRIGYFVGCGIDCMQASTGTASLSLLRRMGSSVTVLDNCCCGLPAWAYGDIEAARKLAVRNLEVMAAADLDCIVTDCASCASFLKSYERLFESSDPYHQTAAAIVPMIEDMVERVSAEGVTVTSGQSQKKRRVTYHDPCHAVRGQGISTAPREILRQLPHLEYVELPEASWCCGGAGSYALENFTLANRVLDRKMANLARTGADILVTACPACMIHLAYGVRKHGLAVRVRHLSQMIPRTAETCAKSDKPSV